MSCHHRILLDLAQYKNHLISEEDQEGLHQYPQVQEILMKFSSDMEAKLSIKPNNHFQIPVLLENGRPVKELSLYGIYYLVTKGALKSLLKENGIQNFDIDNLIKKCKSGKRETSARVVCSNVLDCIRIQIKACLKELRIANYYIQCKPYQNLFRLTNSLPIWNCNQNRMFLNVFDNYICLKQITKSFDTLDLYHFYKAFSSLHSLRYLTLKFDASQYYMCDDNKRKIVEAVSVFRCSSILFPAKDTFPVSFYDTFSVKSIFNAQFKGFNIDSQKCSVQELDLSGVHVNDKLLLLVFNCFSMKKLKLGMTVHCDAILGTACSNLKELCIADNTEITLKNCKYQNLRILELYRCCKVESCRNSNGYMEVSPPFFEYLGTNKSLEQLILIDCASKTSYMSSDYGIVQTVLNGDNNITKLVYNYTDPDRSTCRSRITLVRNPIRNDRLKVLSLRFNSFLSDLDLQNLLNAVRNVTHLDLRGIYINIVAGINLSYLTKLEEFKYSYQVNNSLEFTFQSMKYLRELKYVYIDDVFMACSNVSHLMNMLLKVSLKLDIFEFYTHHFRVGVHSFRMTKDVKNNHLKVEYA